MKGGQVTKHIRTKNEEKYSKGEELNSLKNCNGNKLKNGSKSSKQTATAITKTQKKEKRNHNTILGK